MRTSLARVQIGQQVDLRSQKQQQEYEANNAAIYAVYCHVLIKTQLRGESLLGQERRAASVAEKATEPWFTLANHGKVDVAW